MSYGGGRRRSTGDASSTYLFADSGGRGAEGLSGRETEGEPTAHELIASDDDPRAYHRAPYRPPSVLTGDFGWGRQKKKTTSSTTSTTTKAEAAQPAKPGPSDQKK
ncbi:uncharacterized protein ACA1_078210 [Acanthamoeba castellanii str. Neff]|uniref:Uncharacterized protein n=1 Tax=Acanthamoeba castellanii (strain ATCC 30010 / Neff) TaxID=1257118 RepID=L8GS18_ACACF|nr:uncharacterized protein ACA1_078210 [Acanthamoeba castellanii str. Neff]ELR15780.1 hypothetical protein ACA1_078210 [Acanthamoeba castellanii str. Neff]